VSFQIALQKNLSAPNVVDKNIIDVAYATGVLKDRANILDPVIVIESALTDDIIKRTNYAYIAEFGRWYYVTTITSVLNGLWEISMHVDVLYTYKDQIREQQGIVARQQNDVQMLLDDGWFMCYQNAIVQHIPLSAASPFGSQEFVLVAAG
jgi:hypothetical protein